MRHTWEQYGKYTNHQKKCKECGCIKDDKFLFTTYELNGVHYDLAPPCPEKPKQIDNQIKLF